MNIFNRVMAILALIGLIVALVLGFLQPAASIGAARLGLDGLLAFASANYYLYLLVVAVALLVTVMLLILEVRRPRRLTVKVQQSSGSVVELTTESVARGLEYHIAQLPGIIQVRPKVTSLGKTVRVALDLQTEAAVDVAAKSEEVVQLAREVVESRLGIKLSKVSVSVRQAAYAKGASLPGKGLEAKAVGLAAAGTGAGSDLPPQGPVQS